ncbi:MAG TPA: sugar phosphate isomerase/epimerase family protein [Pirellulaceae bacterium]
MIAEPAESLEETFAMLKEIGFDGVELDSPSQINMTAARAAAEATGFFVDGTVDSRHWQVRLTDPDASVRANARRDLITAIQDTHAAGGNSVLLVPGHGDDGPASVIRERAIEQIERALPVAARWGVHILIENVWNNMFYDPEGPNTQTAAELVRFVDEINNPWLGVQFDVGNHVKYGNPAAWIQQLGKRVVKLDIKDWSASKGFCRIGEGDVPWKAVRAALEEIGYHGWAAAEVEGGNKEALARVSREMDDVLRLG